MKTILNFIAKEMKAIGINYHFGRNKQKKISYPYFVGELIPVDPASEDGMREYTIILDGFNRHLDNTSGVLLELLEETEKIESAFPVVEGKTALVGNQAIAVFLCGVRPVETGDEQLQKVEVTLTIKTWKGSN